jgi:hypothetical protein
VKELARFLNRNPRLLVDIMEDMDVSASGIDAMDHSMVIFEARTA